MACLIAAPCSGSGKTLLSLCLAALVRRRGETIQTFKVGPDYLDPQLLSRTSGRPCRNLDALLCGEGWVRRSFPWWGSQADHCLVEGVMGLFDGRGPGLAGSSAELAQLLGLPVVLVVEASRQAGSVAALVRGFRDHQPGLELAGVVLNGVSTERHQALLSEALAAIAMPLLGVLPRHPSLSLPSRHLGLLPAHELEDLGRCLEEWAALAERHLDLEALMPLLAPPPPPGAGSPDPIRWCLAGDRPGPGPTALVTLAIASDAAFHFRYPEASALLEGLGVSVQPWQPLADEPLPAGSQGVILPGGFPELHAAALAASKRSLADLRRAAGAGLPIYAECGGLLLLGQELEDGSGVSHRMAGLLPFSARRGALQLGYRQATALADGLVVRRGETVCGHEFHRWELEPLPAAATAPPGGPLWQLEGWGWPSRPEGWSRPGLHASWLHLHWSGCPQICCRLRDAAARVRPLTPAAAV
ncbi:cobyrinate a,c-diamide synthase [Synechococcus sp. CS-1325]|uniref:cobyrinate a,c-diamide synthase n=1 Tax=unclassified Synechococcus TaxID=2626047 RepID=UPI0021A59542|nr:MULTISPECIES: cobyrinate a,c-diamide synthase [unclassified Synechococcus]MCT0199089.1 cobyrinate a,c-diamide synthase [Synechococcus sp. CS-1325]MCT0212555.1 cobyrinate a,c-diamide synthase [Synechococcus sp. CS-1326]MCT0232071.1 cobyrinate a,c-diamide synthase [Synechococcus sp. CS-1327]